MRLLSCCALVVGASRGVGRACAVTLAREGCDVALVGRTESHLNETAALCRSARPGARAVVLVCDITRKDGLAALVNRCLTELGGINILVTNSSAVFLSDTESMCNTHAMALIRLCELATPHIRKEASRKHSAIIFVSSLASRVSFKGGAAFSASKLAVCGYAGCLFEDLREENIKISAILPGYISSEMPAHVAALDSTRMIQPQDVADACLFVATFPGTGCPTEIVLRPQRTPYRCVPGDVMAPAAAAAAATASTADLVQRAECTTATAEAVSAAVGAAAVSGGGDGGSDGDDCDAPHAGKRCKVDCGPC